MKKPFWACLLSAVLLGAVLAPSGNAMAAAYSALDSANVCQPVGSGSLAYSWDRMTGDGWRVCPVQIPPNTYATIKGTVYLHNPSGTYATGWLTLVSSDGAASTWCSLGTSGESMSCTLNAGFKGYASYYYTTAANVWGHLTEANY
jgi:hypothetical protein